MTMAADFERRYKMALDFVRLWREGVLTDDEVQILRKWFGLRSDVWVLAELETEKEKNNEYGE